MSAEEKLRFSPDFECSTEDHLVPKVIEQFPYGHYNKHNAKESGSSENENHSW
jgi:hypothetical protein